MVQLRRFIDDEPGRVRIFQYMLFGCRENHVCFQSVKVAIHRVYIPVRFKNVVKEVIEILKLNN